MIISKTPLRASFFGGGTDFSTYYENSKLGYGTVVSTALDMYVYITVNKKFDDSIRIVYSDNELVSNVDEVKHNIIREALKIERGIMGGSVSAISAGGSKGVFLKINTFGEEAFLSKLRELL